MLPCPPRSLVLAGLLGAALLPGSATAQHHGASDSTDHYSHGFEHPERYADEWNDPARDDWQKPDRLLAAMGLEPGMTVADLGTGTGSEYSGILGETKYILETVRRGLAEWDRVNYDPVNLYLGNSNANASIAVELEQPARNTVQ